MRTITADDLGPSTSFDVPTTVARFGSHLYLPNARFTTPPDADDRLLGDEGAREGRATDRWLPGRTLRR